MAKTHPLQVSLLCRKCRNEFVVVLPAEQITGRKKDAGFVVQGLCLKCLTQALGKTPDGNNIH